MSWRNRWRARNLRVRRDRYFHPMQFDGSVGASVQGEGSPGGGRVEFSVPERADGYGFVNAAGGGMEIEKNGFLEGGFGGGSVGEDQLTCLDALAF